MRSRHVEAHALPSSKDGKGIQAETERTSQIPYDSYARYYDLLYQDKDYYRECNFIHQTLQNNTEDDVELILDAGCGTGSHAILLAKRGYRVLGVDASEGMIKEARRKTSELRDEARSRLSFRVARLENMDLTRRVDASIAMFSVLDYFVTDEQILTTLANLWSHMKDRSLFIFDFWYGPAVLKIRPTVRVKLVRNDDQRLLRIAEPQLDADAETCTVKYQLLVMSNRNLIHEYRETQCLRYFFPETLNAFLEKTGFSTLGYSSTLDFKSPPSEEVWSAVCVARAV